MPLDGTIVLSVCGWKRTVSVGSSDILEVVTRLHIASSARMVLDDVSGVS